MSATRLDPVLIVGTGLIGTSIALSLHRAGIETVLDDIDPANLQAAIDRGAGRPLEAGDRPTVVVVAVPPRHAAAVLAEASTRFADATITDVTSVKEQVLADAIAMGADPERLVGGHPMAGREVSGAAGARADLLDDRWWVLTPSGRTDDDHLRRIHRLITTCGSFAVQMTPTEHDEAMALVSHAPQVVSSTLAAQLVNAKDEHLRVAGAGLRDTTRIAASDSALWTDILNVNAAHVADVLEGVIADLAEELAALRARADGVADDIPRVREELRAGAAGRARIPGKHGAAAAEYAEVGVMVADRPGEIGRLFTAVGDAGINLEDMRIEHVLGRPSGLVLLSVRPEVAGDLVSALGERGFDVRG